MGKKLGGIVLEERGWRVVEEKGKKGQGRMWNEREE